MFLADLSDSLMIKAQNKYYYFFFENVNHSGYMYCKPSTHITNNPTGKLELKHTRCMPTLSSESGTRICFGVYFSAKVFFLGRRLVLLNHLYMNVKKKKTLVACHHIYESIN